MPTPLPKALRGDTELVARARLDHGASQRSFRALLDTAARPGALASLPDDAAPGLPRALVPALALADVDVTVAVLDDARATLWQDALRTATGARSGPPTAAQMVVALRPPRPAEVAGLERGTADAPERAARLIIACRTMATHRAVPPVPAPAAERSGPLGPTVSPNAAGRGPGRAGGADARPPTTERLGAASTSGAVDIAVRGPGVPDVRIVRAVGVAVEVLAAIADANREPPAGIDTWLVADDGTIAGFPRSARLSIDEVR